MAEPPAAAAPKPCCVCDAPNGKHCAKCKSRHYCSKACQLVDWNERGHKAQCRQMAAEFQDRLFDELVPAKKPKEAPAIVEDFTPADGATAAARLPAARTEETAVVKATTLNDDALDWLGTCAVCLDLMPNGPSSRRFYECCCKKICKECSEKCQQHDDRCPFCRTPASKSNAEWLRRIQKHSDKGNANAQQHLGDVYHAGERLKQSHKRAVQLYQLAAAQGHAMAQYNLGVCYHLGQGVKIDYKTSVQWCRRAAEQGYSGAQSYLGNAYYKGTGVAQSREEAVRWWRLAAAQGHAGALGNLGSCYANGHGVPQDDTEALRLFKRAAAKGCAGAAAQIERSEKLAANSAAAAAPFF